jgi:hypothetical protein
MNDYKHFVVVMDITIKSVAFLLYPNVLYLLIFFLFIIIRR